MHNNTSSVRDSIWNKLIYLYGDKARCCTASCYIAMLCTAVVPTDDAVRFEQFLNFACSLVSDFISCELVGLLLFSFNILYALLLAQSFYGIVSLGLTCYSFSTPSLQHDLLCVEYKTWTQSISWHSTTRHKHRHRHGHPRRLVRHAARFSSRGCLLAMRTCTRILYTTRSIWKMLGPFATASRLTPIHQLYRYCRAPPAHRCPRHRRRRQRQRQRVTEGTAMAPWNGPNNSCTRLQNYTIGASLMSVSVPWNSSYTQQ